MIYVRYHKFSGAIDIQVLVSHPRELARHAVTDHDFLEVTSTVDYHSYVDPETKTIRHPDQKEFQVEKFTLFLDEGFDINAPAGTWIKEEVAGYILVKDDAIEIPAPGRNHFTNAFTLGKDHGRLWQFTWKEADVVRSEAMALVDAKAQELLDVSTSKQSVYKAKYDAALAFLAKETLTPNQQFILENEALRIDDEVENAAKIIVQKAEAAELLALKVDNTRLKTKKAIKNATSGLEIKDILSFLEWPQGDN